MRMWSSPRRKRSGAKKSGGSPSIAKVGKTSTPKKAKIAINTSKLAEEGTSQGAKSPKMMSPKGKSPVHH